MTAKQELHMRSESKCELCGATQALEVYEVPPDSNGSPDQSVLVCDTCLAQIENPEKMDAHHWRCLNDSMWSQTPAVQVMAWRMLSRLRHEGWPQDLLDMLYLDEETQAWAKAMDRETVKEEVLQYIDSNGVALSAGDSVTIIKDLNVKGGGFTAKRGTMVRGISLDPENNEQIEGRVNGQVIVIFTKFVKKAN